MTANCIVQELPQQDLLTIHLQIICVAAAWRQATFENQPATRLRSLNLRVLTFIIHFTTDIYIHQLTGSIYNYTFQVKVKHLYLAEKFLRIPGTLCSSAQNPIFNTSDHAKYYCEDNVNCGGFVDHRGEGKSIAICFRPVDRISSTDGSTLYIKSGKLYEKIIMS